MYSNPRLIYIAGVGHSGVLDMALGAHPKIIGFGEVFNFLKASPERKKQQITNSVCSCMKSGTECEFWYDAESVFNPNSSISEHYINLYKHFKSKNSENFIFLDSSKNVYSELLDLSKYFDILIIHLTRGVRSWVYSRIQARQRSAFVYAVKWFLLNKKNDIRLKSLKIKYMNVGYEEFALAPDTILKQICRFLDLEFDEKNLHPELTKSHIINGNIA